MIKITYYVLLDKIHFDLTNVVAGACQIDFQVTRSQSESEKPVKLPNDKVQLSETVIFITEKNGRFAEIVFPPYGISLINTDQFLLFSHSVFFVADAEISVKVRVNGLESEVSFVVPRPPKPFQSWSWSDGRWNAPVPMPSDGEYEWDETSLTWVLV